jgi:phosphoadenosine phosphosulfate reductase
VEPLQRALKGKTILITGLREEHLPEGRHVDQLEWDAINQVTKFYPLLHWTSETSKLIHFENNIPYNALHNKGFVNIGCAPCTRAIKPGEAYSAAKLVVGKETGNRKDKCSVCIVLTCENVRRQT